MCAWVSLQAHKIPSTGNHDCDTIFSVEVKKIPNSLCIAFFECLDSANSNTQIIRRVFSVLCSVRWAIFMRTLNNMQQQACKQNTNIYIFIHASPVENTYICGVDLSFIGFIISCGEQFSSIKVVDVDKTNASKWKVVAHYNDTTLCVCVRLSPYFSCYHCVCVYLLFSRIYSTPFEPTIYCINLNAITA